MELLRKGTSNQSKKYLQHVLPELAIVDSSIELCNPKDFMITVNTDI